MRGLPLLCGFLCGLAAPACDPLADAEAGEDARGIRAAVVAPGTGSTRGRDPGSPGDDRRPSVSGGSPHGNIAPRALDDSPGDTGAPCAPRGAMRLAVHLEVPDRLERVRLAADRSVLPEVFRRVGYVPPDGAEVLLAEITRGPLGLEYRYVTLGAGAFLGSAGRFYPASTVKPMAVVGALTTLQRAGLTGAAEVRFTFGGLEFWGPVRRLVRDALGYSSNLAFDQLMVLAGFDAVNRDLLGPGSGLPGLALQESLYGAEIRYSPSIAYVEGRKAGRLPARWGSSQHADCPGDQNCATLYALQEVVRRLLLHDEVERRDRFPIGREDRAEIRRWMRRYPSRLAGAGAAALGPLRRVWTSLGYVPGHAFLETALLVPERGAARYLLTALVPYPDDGTPQPVVEERLAALGHQALLALVETAGRAPTVTADLGADLRAWVRSAECGHRLFVAAPGTEGITLRLPDGRALSLAPEGAGFAVDLPSLPEGRHLVTIQASACGAPVATALRVLVVGAR